MEQRDYGNLNTFSFVPLTITTFSTQPFEVGSPSPSFLPGNKNILKMHGKPSSELISIGNGRGSHRVTIHTDSEDDDVKENNTIERPVASDMIRRITFHGRSKREKVKDKRALISKDDPKIVDEKTPLSNSEPSLEEYLKDSNVDNSEKLDESRQGTITSKPISPVVKESIDYPSLSLSSDIVTPVTITPPLTTNTSPTPNSPTTNTTSSIPPKVQTTCPSQSTLTQSSELKSPVSKQNNSELWTKLREMTEEKNKALHELQSTKAFFDTERLNIEHKMWGILTEPFIDMAKRRNNLDELLTQNTVALSSKSKEVIQKLKENLTTMVQSLDTQQKNPKFCTMSTYQMIDFISLNSHKHDQLFIDLCKGVGDITNTNVHMKTDIVNLNTKLDTLKAKVDEVIINNTLSMPEMIVSDVDILYQKLKNAESKINSLEMMVSYQTQVIDNVQEELVKQQGYYNGKILMLEGFIKQIRNQ